MTPREIEAYLHRHIPLSLAMGVSVRACNAQAATLRAPLAPNINHRSTVFGGSASAVAILAAWTWLHFALRTAGERPTLVIQGNSVAYLAPITGEFEARCAAPLPAEFERFVRVLQRRGKARIALQAVLTCGTVECATFSGDFVALAAEPA